jgi:FkbM family methyltransferase
MFKAARYLLRRLTVRDAGFEGARIRPTWRAAAVAHAFKTLHHHGIVPDYELLLEGAYSKIIRPGDVVVDVGAHAGRHLKRFASLVGPSGRVIGFEPIPHLAEALKSEPFENKGITDVRRIALSDHTGRDTFKLAENAIGMSGLKERDFRMEGVLVRDIDVEADTLDNQLADLERLDFMKIDIEGGEIDCLNGGRKVIARHRPVISVEYGYPSYSVYGLTSETLFNWAVDNGYRLSDLFGNEVESAEEWRNVCDVSFWDFVLRPLDRPRG